MLFNLAVVLVLSLIVYEIFSKFKIPGILGIILLGIVLGPSGYNYIDKRVLDLSSDLRSVALIIILLRAGFGIEKKSLIEGKGAVVKMSTIPGIVEGFTIAFASIYLLGFSFIEGGMLGFVIAAVSPAIIVPKMLLLKEKTKSNLPNIVLASSAIDDIVAITIFTTFLNIYRGSGENIFLKVAEVPLSIVSGIIFGVIVGYILLYIFNRKKIRDTKKAFLILLIGILMNGVEKIINAKYSFEIASLLGVMSIGFVLLNKKEELGSRLSQKFNKMWVFAEVILFLLVGASVNISVIEKSGLSALIIILLGLIGRSIGVLIALKGEKFKKNELVYGVISFIPKATVQAAMGGVAMQSGVARGEIILAVSVVAILVTAPLGSILLNKYSYLIEDNEEKNGEEKNDEKNKRYTK